MRLIQLHGPDGRRTGLVEGDAIRLLEGARSVYALALAALSAGIPLAQAASDHAGGERLDYDAIYEGGAPWRILPCIDHPEEPSRCMVSGTGLSHMRSADNRQAMHAADEQLTDSMRMYQWGVEGGRPEAGRIGVSPEWFYKGTGNALRAHGEALEIPAYAEDGGEEPEIAGIYVIDAGGHAAATLEWRPGTNFPIMFSKSGITSIWHLPSCETARSVRSWQSRHGSNWFAAK